MKNIYVIRVFDRSTDETYEWKAYTQEWRVSKYCNNMFRKYGESVQCEVFKNDILMETWGA